MKIAFVLPIAVAVLAMGCAGQPSDDVADEGSAEATADLSGKVKHHYTPGVSDVVWKAGCGVVHVGAPPCPSGLFLTYTKNYVDLTFTHSERVDNGTHTLTIHVDAWSYNTIHPMIAVHPETIQLSPKNLQMSTHYDVVVKDRRENVLWTGTIATYLAL